MDAAGCVCDMVCPVIEGTFSDDFKDLLPEQSHNPTISGAVTTEPYTTKKCGR